MEIICACVVARCIMKIVVMYVVLLKIIVGCVHIVIISYLYIHRPIERDFRLITST